jgi:hypothetical protein
MASGTMVLEAAGRPNDVSRKPPLLVALIETARDPLGRWRLAGASVSLLMLAGLFANNLRHFAFTWSTDDNYSHGFLVPLLSLYFANDAASRPRETTAGRGGVALGSLLLLGGILVKLATVLVRLASWATWR